MRPSWRLSCVKGDITAQGYGVIEILKINMYAPDFGQPLFMIVGKQKPHPIHPLENALTHDFVGGHVFSVGGRLL